MLVAVEIPTTAWCPNNCRYCYVPKGDAMRELHHELVGDLKAAKYIERLKDVYGDRLKMLGLWGAEPTLTMDLVKDRLPEILEAFPKLESIGLSTSMIDHKPIVRFAKALPSTIKFRVQVSLDGPGFITDVNRFDDASKIIPSNFIKLVKGLQGTEAKVDLHWKATLTRENINEMVSEPSKVDEYINYFEAINDESSRINQSKRLILNKRYAPTLAVPGEYTSSDGRNFAELIKIMKAKGCLSVYSSRMRKVIDLQEELSIKKRMFTCSGGDSNSGIDDNYHICHRSFFLDDDRCVENIARQGDINWDYANYHRGTLDLLRKRYIVPLEDKEGITRISYVLRNYHDFWRMQIGYVKAMMYELALVRQASQDYLKDDELSTLFGLFVGACLSCPLDNLLRTSSVHLASVSLLRMFGNGAFQEILKDVLPNRK